MASAKGSGRKAPTERPDKEAAARDPKGAAEDRPGFDLGGAVDPDKARSELPPRGPGSSPGQGATATGQADGYTNVSGSRPRGKDTGSGSESGSGPTDSTP